MKITDEQQIEIINILQGGTTALQAYFDLVNKEVTEPTLNYGRLIGVIFSTLDGIGVPLDKDMQRQFRGKFTLDEGVWKND
jgi:hypothetical protein